MTIRLATVTDIPAIAEVARITWADTYRHVISPENQHRFLQASYNYKSLKASLTSPNRWFYVVEAEDKQNDETYFAASDPSNVVGFAHFIRRYYANMPQAELVRLYVLPGYQGRGYGAQLLQTGIDALRDSGVTLCFVSSQTHNTRARAFYERNQFAYYREYGQFIGNQIITLVEYVRTIHINPSAKAP